MEQPSSIGIVYIFDHFRLDKHGRQLVRQGIDGKAVPMFLGTRAFDVLLALVERSGEVVSKAQILDAVWPGLAIGEVNLTVQISAVRRAVDHGRDSPSLIRTIHGRGYLFAGAVTQEITPSPPNGSSPKRPLSADKRVSDMPGNVAAGHSRYPRTRKASEDTESDEERLERRTPERRQLTVMTCEVVELATLPTRLDLEDLCEVTAACHMCCREVVERYRGYVANYTSGGALAYFGYPQADEHDADRAVRAGLALVDAMPKLSTAAGNPLHVRVGVATGLVAASNPSGSDPAQTVSVVGETPNLAMHLQTLAQPDMVFVSQATRSHLGRLFNYRDVGAIKFEGLLPETPVWQVLSENRTFGLFEALRSDATPLVGRDEEMDLLSRRWSQAKAGGGRVVLISAEPGVGKSRLAEALAEKIAAEPHTRLRYFCSPHHQDSALYPMIGQMERAAGFAHGDRPEGRLAKLQKVLAPIAPPMEDVALLAELHSLPLPDLGPTLDLSPQRKKDKMFEALLRQVESLSRPQPVLMLFDDIHWIDPSSLELLDRLIERIVGWRVLLLAMFRPEFQPPWTGQPHVTLLTLPRLDRRNTAAMVANVAGDTGLPSEIVEEITERTDGVPLFVEELTKAVLEAGTPNPTSSVPATLHSSLMARLERLGPAAKDVAQTGAAIGREFGFGLLAFVTDLTEPQLQEALDRLTDSGLLLVRGSPPTYTFKHALVQDAAYGTLLRNRRQRLHGRIVATLEDRFLEVVSAQPALLARHCAEAGLAEKAVAYWLQAGQQSLDRSAMVEAVTQLGKGLHELSGLPNGPWNQQQELELQLALAAALSATAGFPAAEFEKARTRARALAEQVGRPEHLVPLIAVQWPFHLLRSEHRIALSLAEQLEQIGESGNDTSVKFIGRFTHGIVRLSLGEFVHARTILQRCIGLADPAHLTMGLMSVDPYPCMLTWLAVTLAILGYVDQARSLRDEALSKARRLGHVHTLAVVFAQVHWIDWLTRSPMVHIAEMLALTTEHGFPFFLAWARAYHGLSLIALGQAKEGLAFATQGLMDFRATGAAYNTPVHLAFHAEAYAMLGQPAEGLNSLVEAAQFVETTEERIHEAELHRMQGDLLNATGDRSAAERQYRQAIAVAERQSAKLFQLRASVSLARLWRDQGKRAEARDLLGLIYNWFTEGFDAPDLQNAKALLDELAEAVAAGTAV